MELRKDEALVEPLNDAENEVRGEGVKVNGGDLELDKEAESDGEGVGVRLLRGVFVRVVEGV